MTPGLRSFADPLSNATFIRGIDLRAHLASILGGQLPVGCVVPFIHEFTHHWCLFSSFGNALALVQLRALRTLNTIVEHEDELSTADRDDLLWVMFDDYVRYVATISILRPLLEGIAVFAEADLWPGTSPIISNVTYWLARAFARDYVQPEEARDGEPESEQVARAVHRLLIDVRGSGRDYLDRRESILSEPLSAVGTGYLAGYLYVRDIWLEATASDKRYHDRDLFLCALRSFLFDDPGLAAHMLDPDTRDVGAAAAISTYVGERLQMLEDGRFAALTDKLIAAAAARPAVTPITEPVVIGRNNPALAQMVNVGTDPELFELGLQRIAEGFADAERDSAGQQNLITQGWLLAKREMLAIGETESRVEVTTDGRVICTVDGSLLLEGPILGKSRTLVASGHHTGSVRVLLFPYQGFTGLAVNVSGIPVLTACSEEASALMRAQFDTLMLGVEIHAEQGEAIRSLVKGAVRENEFMGQVLDEIHQAIERGYQFFAQRPLRFLSPDRREATSREFNRAGFGAVLGGRKELRLLTWLSTFAPMQPEISRLEEIFDEYGDFHRYSGTVHEAVEHIRSLSRERLGAELLYASGGLVVSFV